MLLNKLSFIVLLVFFISCTSSKEKNFEEKSIDEETLEEIVESKPTVEKDLGDILKEGKLRVSTTYSGTSYFLYRGQPLGFEYELLERFADHLGVEIEIVVANDINNLITELQENANINNYDVFISLYNRIRTKSNKFQRG